LIISACLFYAGIFDTPDQAMIHFAKRRSKSGTKGIKQPSQKRYLMYFSEIITGEKSLFDSYSYITEVKNFFVFV